MVQDLSRHEITLNMGPQHPSTHGVLRVILDLEGETVVKTTPVIGYLHRATEKHAEHLKYHQIIPYTDRLDYIAAPSNNLAYCQAVEKLLDLEIPLRAQYIRVMLAELARISSHLLWLGTHAMDIGAITVFLYCLRERESILDLFESFCGARLTTNTIRIGGLPADLPEGWVEGLQKFIDILPGRIQEYETLLTENPIWTNRTQGIAVISAEDAISYGLTGACLRGSGVNYDVRKAQPYAVYDRLDFDVPLGEHGDIFDRYLVRVGEMQQAVRILQQCIDQLPEGPILAEARGLVPPPKERVMTSIESMTEHFWLYIHGVNAPVGDVYSSVEAPKGELGFYLISDGTGQPYRMKIRSPSFVNLQSLPVLTEGRMVADVVAAIGSIDIVLGEVDR